MSGGVIIAPDFVEGCVGDCGPCKQWASGLYELDGGGEAGCGSVEDGEGGLSGAEAGHDGIDVGGLSSFDEVIGNAFNLDGGVELSRRNDDCCGKSECRGGVCRELYGDGDAAGDGLGDDESGGAVGALFEDRCAFGADDNGIDNTGGEAFEVEFEIGWADFHKTDGADAKAGVFVGGFDGPFARADFKCVATGVGDFGGELLAGIEIDGRDDTSADGFANIVYVIVSGISVDDAGDVGFAAASTEILNHH